MGSDMEVKQGSRAVGSEEGALQEDVRLGAWAPTEGAKRERGVGGVGDTGVFAVPT